MNLIKNRYTICGKCGNRNSSVELLRILSMLMIVVHHFIIDTMYSVPEIIGTEGEVTPRLGASIMINGLCYIGVNCFILISGFFGIKLRTKGVLKLWLVFSFYVALGLYLKDGIVLNNLTILKVMLPFWYSGKWFMHCYLILCFISPFLNRTIDKINKQNFQSVLILFTIINIGFGFFLQDSYNSNGYNVANFVYLYLIGGYIRRFVNLNKTKTSSLVLFYLLFGIGFGLFAIISHFHYIPFYKSYAYNNPFLMCAAISFSMIFFKYNYYNKTINWLASSCLAVYLFGHMSYRQDVADYIMSYDGYCWFFVFLVCVAGYALSNLMISVLIDKIRIIIVEKPILFLYDKSKINKIDKYFEV